MSHTLYIDLCKECKPDQTFTPFSLLYLSAKQVIVNNKNSECDFIKSTTLEFHLQNFRFGHQKKVYSVTCCPIASGKELIDSKYPGNKIIKNYCACRYPVCFDCAVLRINRKLNSHLKNCVNPYK